MKLASFNMDLPHARLETLRNESGFASPDECAVSYSKLPALISDFATDDRKNMEERNGGCSFRRSPPSAESVAWIAERKDALSTFFWMLNYGRLYPVCTK